MREKVAAHATSLRGEDVDVDKSRELKPRTHLDIPGLDVRFQADRQGRRQLSSGSPGQEKPLWVRSDCEATSRLWRELSSTIPGSSRKLL